VELEFPESEVHKGTCSVQSIPATPVVSGGGKAQLAGLHTAQLKADESH
jgi:hypothetical protein